ncbi:hypothetical protein COV20_03170 [Candidatus Woesearchaeota archaeon CG10_big_fil_rev_8_21_14_0_10_45_16]|nr:MAG: hypothetical protein COV20_03170 [Candidatus Woesearchaeota archaeon CG10_big_fil_rev_8_21_14_0_10_45_16]
MDFTGTIRRNRQARSRKLSSLGKFLLSLGLNANILTTLSLISGLLSIYFLFSHYWYFLLFAVIHLLFDALDGVVARVSKETSFGRYFDLAVDNVIAVLLFVKAGWYLGSIYPYLAAVLYLISILIYLLSRLQSPILFVRTFALIFLFVVLFPGFPYLTGSLTIGSLVGGLVSVYSLVMQMWWKLRSSVS